MINHNNFNKESLAIAVIWITNTLEKKSMRLKNYKALL